MKNGVKLSQCMIVKNEESNIRKALEWGQPFVCEQIVVDTGSSDRTVEIAREFGAKIYSFPWKDDFAAAKNFALEKASGDWIAFLDADEYLKPEDAAGLFALLEKLGEEPVKSRPDIIRCAWVHLDEHGKAFAVDTQDRIFKNSPSIRFQNRIHEVLHHSQKEVMSCRHSEKDLTIYHTGYSAEAYHKTGKLERNIRILSEALSENETWYEGWSYLGNSYMLTKEFPKAKEAYKMAVSHLDVEYDLTHKITMLSNLIKISVLNNSLCQYEEVLSFYQKFLKLGSHFPDADYWMSLYYMQHEEYKKGIALLENALNSLENYQGDAVLVLPGQLDTAYAMLMKAYKETGNLSEAVRNGILSLRANPYQEEILSDLLEMFNKAGEKAENVLKLIQKLYMPEQHPRDRIFVLYAALKSGFAKLEKNILELCTEDEKKMFKESFIASWHLTKSQCLEKYPEIICRNETDRAFCILMEKLRICPRFRLLDDLQKNIALLRKEHTDSYMKLSSFVKASAYWGKLEWDNPQCSHFVLRIDNLLHYREQLIHLYASFGDNRSRKILLAVVNNWLTGDMRLLSRTVDHEPCWFDTDLIPESKNGVFVDIGAADGETTLSYLETYGEDYSRIYCYEPIHSSYEKLTVSLQERSDIFLNFCDSITDIELGKNIQERISFIKVDAYGEEVQAIENCRRHITLDHPKMAVAACYGFDELLTVSEKIWSIEPSYKLYLRNYGEDYFPNKIILYAI